MRENTTVRHEFVEFIPDELEQATLYVSIRFATASHLCCCGCGNKVVTPLRPTDWKLIFDGKTISLDPSIGNWSFRCRSHYWIRNNQVIWAPRWNMAKIAFGRQLDRDVKNLYFGHSAAASGAEPPGLATSRPKQKRGRQRVTE